MEIRVKRRHSKGVDRIHGIGDIKEISVNTDLFHTENNNIQVCFRGEHCSGIIHFSSKEAKDLSKQLARVSKIGKGIKVIKFEG